MKGCDERKAHRHLLTLFLCLSAAWPALLFTGCGSLKDIPSASTAESGRVTPVWSEVPGVTGYAVYMSTSAGVTKQNGKKISNVKNPHRITGWKPGMTYYFVVTAVNKDGESQESAEMSYTVS